MNIKISTLRIKIIAYVGALKIKTCVQSLRKQTMGVISICKILRLNWSLPTEEIFQVHGEYQPVANLLVVDFRSQPREMPLPKPLNT